MKELEIIKQLNRLSSSNRSIKKQAIRYFAFNPDPRCISIIRRILKSENDEKIIRWASYALALNKDYDSRNLLDNKIEELDNPESQAVEWLKISKEILKKENRFNYIISLLNSKCIDDAKEGLILSFAYKQKPQKLINKIINTPFTSYSDIDRWKNLTLGNTTSFKDSDIIIPYLDDTNFLVREWAAWALSRILNIKSINELRKKINDDNPRVREWIAKAIAMFNLTDDIYLLMDHYHKENDPLCKEGIVRSLNSNNKQVQEFVENELESQINKCDFILVVALLDKLSQCSISNYSFDILERLYFKYDNIEIREAIAQMAFSSLDKKDRDSVLRFSSKPYCNFIIECFKETRIFKYEGLYDKKKFNYIEDSIPDFSEDYTILLNGENESEYREVAASSLLKAGATDIPKKFKTNQSPKRDKLYIEYNEGPIVLFTGMEIKGFSELSFVMLLNLAARRKSDNPKKGLAHKEDDLLDESQGFKNYDNLKKIFRNQNCSHFLQPNRKKTGKLMKDHKVYLNIEPVSITIGESIRNFRSTHRKEIEKLLEDLDNERNTDVQVKKYYERLENVLNYMNRNESLVNDAIKRLGWEMRSLGSLSEIKRLTKQAENVLTAQA